MFRSELPSIVVLASGNGSNFETIVKKSFERHLRAKVLTLIVDKLCPAVEKAEKLSVPYYVLKKPIWEDLDNLLEDLKPDLIVLAGFMRIIPDWIVRKYYLKIVNIHPSLLPAFPGKDAIKQAYDYGVKITGITIHFVDEGVDTGPIILQKAIEIDNNWNLEELESEIHRLEHENYWKVIDKILNEGFKLTGRKVAVGG